MSLLRLLHTLRWLRREQLVGQLHHRLRTRLERPRVRGPAPPYPGCRWQPRQAFLPPGGQRNTADALRDGRFVFLNRCEAIGWPPRWECPGLPLLWEYNLHYFEWLWALDWQAGRTVVGDWIERHGLARGRVGWEPYPISLRLVNWCAFFLGRHREATEADGAFRERLWSSLHDQAAWLASHLEFHLLGNHLFENAAALAFVGACFDGDAARAWRARGLALLDRELREQVLPDGGHFERSPMYQLRIAFVLSQLAATGDAGLASRLEEPLARSLAALDRLRHPDGEIALLNDSALGIANPPGDLLPADPPPGPFALADTGYYGARTGTGDYVVCDAAPIGPDYLPGHAHADLLSFELSLGGQRVLVDAGVHDYELGELRRWSRSTRAHNTVELEGEDQCELWGAFRVGRRGHPRDVRWTPLADGFRLEAAHDGYARLAGRPLHRRTFRWHERGVLLVRDRVEGGRPVIARSRLHLHPDCTLLETRDGEARVGHPGGELRIRFAGPGELSVEPSLHFPEFGVRRESVALTLTARGARIDNGFCVAKGASRLGYDVAAGAEVDGTPMPW